MASAVAAQQSMAAAFPAPEATLQMKLQPKVSGGMVPHPPPGVKPLGKLRLDPQRALEPARKKLSTVEAQRIMSVFGDTIRKIQLLTSLPYVLDNLDRYKIVLGSDLTHILQGHQVILNSFEDLKLSAEKLLQDEGRIRAESADELKEDDFEEEELEGELRNLSHRDEETSLEHRVHSPSEYASSHSKSRPASVGRISSQADEAMKSLSMVAQQMQHSCKNIMRAFAINPTAVNTILNDIHVERGENANELISEMSVLKDILMGKLLTTPVEENERVQYLREISERERYNAGIIAKLDTELQAAMEDKQQEITKKNDVIRRLQADLKQIQKFSEEHIKRTKSEAEKQEAADAKNSDGKKSKLQLEAGQLRIQLQTLTSEHRENELTLRKKKYKIETEVENWIQKYDQDMGERQDEFEEIDGIYTEEKKQLNELEERFKTLETEYDQIMEERRIAREKREAAERELQQCVSAATTIQAFWRSFKVRKALKGKKKKGGKGKKGKK